MSYLATPGTFSKSPACWGFEDNLTVTEADGAYVTLSTSGRCLDWVSGLGSNLFGYARKPFVDYVYTIGLSGLGGSLSLPSYLETRVAEKLCLILGSHVPGWSPDFISARFAKTGSDVTTMAVRLARAVTNRPYVLTFKGHYHGWGDWTVSRTNPAWGVIPLEGDEWAKMQWQQIREEQWGDDNIGGYFRFDEIAAIIFEQGITDPPPGWYDYLRKLCDQTGTLLIADEVVTGLRYGLGGACERYGIKPDLICMGKGLGNGLPISALVGRRDLMDWFNRVDPVFCSSTMWGESVGLAAADWVLAHLGQDEVDYIWQVGNRLMAGSTWPVVGHGVRSLFKFDNEYEQGLFIQEMKRRGILVNRPNFPTLAHTDEDVTRTLAALTEVKEQMDNLDPDEIVRLVGDKPPKVLFKQR